MISNQGLLIICENKFAHDLVQMDIGCSSVWVTHAILGQNYIKRTWVALQCGLLMPIWVKTILKRHGLLFSMGCSSCFGSNYYKKDVGCSSVWVAHVKIHFYVRLQSLP